MVNIPLMVGYPPQRAVTRSRDGRVRLSGKIHRVVSDIVPPKAIYLWYDTARETEKGFKVRFEPFFFTLARFTRYIA